MKLVSSWITDFNTYRVVQMASGNDHVETRWIKLAHGQDSGLYAQTQALIIQSEVRNLSSRDSVSHSRYTSHILRSQKQSDASEKDILIECRSRYHVHEFLHNLNHRNAQGNSRMSNLHQHTHTHVHLPCCNIINIHIQLPLETIRIYLKAMKTSKKRWTQWIIVLSKGKHYIYLTQYIPA